MSAEVPNVQASRVRVLLYVALALSAALALLGHQEIQLRVMDGSLPPETRLAPAAVFFIALLLYAVDRVLLVRNRGYPSGKAFFQVGFGLMLITFLLPGGLRDYQDGRSHRRGGDAVTALMRHSDARVRALAAEVAGNRTEGDHLGALVELLEDPSESVRSSAQAALERRTGKRMGTGPAAVTAWQNYLKGAAAPAPAERAAP
ncbi:MAG: HEAT repeat domain-containing protein [Deltaproteobacteria bacterium]|nr:HEAT repeat domain-containing protein [Deltaproteobacteria bacterium]